MPKFTTEKIYKILGFVAILMGITGGFIAQSIQNNFFSSFQANSSSSNSSLVSSFNIFSSINSNNSSILSANSSKQDSVNLPNSNPTNSSINPEIKIVSSDKGFETSYIKECDINLKYEENTEFKNNLTQEKYMNKFNLDKFARGIDQSGATSIILYCSKNTQNFENVKREMIESLPIMGKEEFCVKIKAEENCQKLERFFVSRDPNGQFPDKYHFVMNGYFYIIGANNYEEFIPNNVKNDIIKQNNLDLIETNQVFSFKYRTGAALTFVKDGVDIGCTECELLVMAREINGKITQKTQMVWQANGNNEPEFGQKYKISGKIKRFSNINKNWEFIEVYKVEKI